MKALKIGLVVICLAVVCAPSCNASSNDQEKTESRKSVPESSAQGQHRDSEVPSETVSGAERTAEEQATAGDVVEQLDGDQKEREGEGEESVKEETKNERFVVSYIPDYPSSITQPWMLANGTHFIMFYASWCSYSEAAVPHFMAVLQHVVDHNITGINMGKIEVTKNGEIAKHFKIQSTPTFAIYHRGAHYVFEDEVSGENFISFLLQVLAINLTEVSTASQLSELKRAHPVLFLLAHDGQRDPDWHYSYSHMAQEKGLLAKFSYTTKTDLVEDFNVTKFPTLMVLKDGEAIKFSSSLSNHNLAKWIKRERHPALPVVDAKTFRPFTKFVLGRKLAILVVHEDPAEQRITEKRVIDTVRRVAHSRKLVPHFQFVQLTSLELAERITMSPITELPYLFIYTHLTGYHYPYQPPEGEKGITESGIVEFCNRVRNKKVEPQGGTESYMNSVQHLWLRLYSIYQTMVTHRPYLSLGAAFSLCCVAMFYTYLCLGRQSSNSQSVKKPRKIIRRTRGNARQLQTGGTAVNIHNGGEVRRRRRAEEEQGTGAGEGEEGEELFGSGSDSGNGAQEYSDEDEKTL